MTPGQGSFNNMCCAVASLIDSLLGFGSSKGAGMISGLFLGLRDLHIRRRAGQ